MELSINLINQFNLFNNTKSSVPEYLFVTDLHGHVDRYRQLFELILSERPAVVLLGGDLLPHAYFSTRLNGEVSHDFISDFLVPEFNKLRKRLKSEYPKVILIMGNDDTRIHESAFIKYARSGIWEYLHFRSITLDKYQFYGYSYVPPTPFTLKDWEKYDVSRFVDPGCISPEEGYRTVAVPGEEIRYGTIQQDLEKLTEGKELHQSIFLFHSPPYQTAMDRADLDGQLIDHVPLDVHVGSIAIKRFIEARQPHITLHGHVHESSRLTGAWRQKIGRTHLFSAACEAPELAVIRFHPDRPGEARREILSLK